MAGGDSGAAIVPGKVEESLLIKAVRYTDAELAMPPKKKGGKLPAADLAKLEQWVAMGARTRATARQKAHGADGRGLGALGVSASEKACAARRAASAVAAHRCGPFILAKLEAAGLEPSAPADPDALLRRLFYDLWGLPPTTEQATAFAQQWAAANGDAKAQDAALERVVDYLLRSPHYGDAGAAHRRQSPTSPNTAAGW